MSGGQSSQGQQLDGMNNSTRGCSYSILVGSSTVLEIYQLQYWEGRGRINI